MTVKIEREHSSTQRGSRIADYLLLLSFRCFLSSFSLSLFHSFSLSINTCTYRETLLPHWWEGEDIALYGGKDVKAGGSWLAVSKCGRVAFLTNFREKVNKTKAITIFFFFFLCFLSFSLCHYWT